MNKWYVNVINKFCLKNNMKNYNNNSSLSSKEVRVYQMTAKETVGTIQNISKNIKEYSQRMRETMNTLRESGVIPEMADAIREASFAVRDTAKDINETTQELKKNGVLVDAASAVEHALKSAEQSLATVKEISTDAGKASPNTTKAMQDGIDSIKKKTSQVTEKMVKGVKHKQAT
jgi:methyl-accepting chemotaxis protein